MQGYFVRANVSYQPTETRGDLSDIDIVALHPLTGDAIACEVKGWHTEDLTMSTFQAWKLLRFTTPPAIAAVRELIGDRPFRQILLTSRPGPQSGELVRAYAAKHGVELLHWPQVLCEMAAQVTPSKSARNATDHVMRVLTVYGLLEDPT